MQTQTTPSTRSEDGRRNERGDDLLLWLDVETTGLDPSKDPIIEIGMRTTKFDLTDIDSLSTPVLPHGWSGRDDTRLDDYTRALHGGNRLLTVLDAISSVGDPYGDSYSASHVADRLRSAIVEPALARGRVYLAGSSVAFDRNMVTAQMPGLLSGLEHRIVDVSTIMEIVLHLGDAAGIPKPLTDHRVDNCLRDSIALYRHFLPLLAPHPVDATGSVCSATGIGGAR